LKYSAKMVYCGNVEEVGKPLGPRLTVRRLQKHGHGTMYYEPSKQYFYEGDWVNDVKSGRGLMSVPSAVYDGSWANDAAHGTGSLQTAKSRMSLQLSKGKPLGNFVAQVETGESVAGKFSEHGTVPVGTVRLGSQDVVEWVWKDRVPGTGEVRVAFSNGDHYVGVVHNFKPHGNGHFTFAEGHSYSGSFVDGCMAGEGSFMFNDNNVYTGGFVGGQFEGKGRYTFGSEYVYEGTWKSGQMHGRGRVLYANGDVWEGEFLNNQRKTGRYVHSTQFQLVA